MKLKKWSLWCKITNDDGDVLSNNPVSEFYTKRRATHEAYARNSMWAVLDSIYHRSIQHYYVKARSY